jgi:hypothetical protein
VRANGRRGFGWPWQRKTQPTKPVLPQQDPLSEALIAHLYWCMANTERGNWPLRWVMSPAWYEEIQQMTDSSGYRMLPDIPLDTLTILGYPVEVHPFAGTPHLEAQVAVPLYQQRLF